LQEQARPLRRSPDLVWSGNWICMNLQWFPTVARRSR
jgi:hypothetical protein